MASRLEIIVGIVVNDAVASDYFSVERAHYRNITVFYIFRSDTNAAYDVVIVS